MADARALGDAKYTIQEATGTPGMDVQCTFTAVDAPIVDLALHVTGHYDGNPVHNLQIEAWNGATWTTLSAPSTVMESRADDAEYVWNFTNANQLSAGTVIVRFHHTTAGNPTHVLYLDWMRIDGVHATPTPTVTATPTLSPTPTVTATPSGKLMILRVD